VDNATVFVLVVAIMSLTGISAIAQHKYYARTVKRLAREHDEPGHMLVTGRGKSRFRGAIAVLVLRKHDEVIKAAVVMEGASVLARFKSRPDCRPGSRSLALHRAWRPRSPRREPGCPAGGWRRRRQPGSSHPSAAGKPDEGTGGHRHCGVRQRSHPIAQLRWRSTQSSITAWACARSAISRAQWVAVVVALRPDGAAETRRARR
jgi:DNA-binding transcriptional regulator of glucitol operon